MDFKYIYKKILLIIIFSLLSYQIVNAGGLNMSFERDLSLYLKTDKNTYNIGDTIKFECRIENISKKNITIYPFGALYNKDWISFFNKMTNEQMDGKITILIEPTFPLNKCNFKQLKEKEDFTYTFYGIINNGEVSYVAANEKWQVSHNGLYIKLDNSVILLDGSGTFKIRAYFETMREDIIAAKGLINTKDVWTGKIRSNEIEIKIN